MRHPLTSTGEPNPGCNDQDFYQLETCEAGNSEINPITWYLSKKSIIQAFYNAMFHHHSYKL
jgi:hypothetical protein